MKTLYEYMSLPYRMELIEDKTEGGYTVIFPELPGCLTCGETLQEAYENAIDAKREWMIAALEEGMKISKECSEMLEKAEKKITMLIKGDDGELTEENFVQNEE